MGRNRKERDYTLLKTTRHSIAYQTELERRPREEHKSVAQVQREDAIARIGAVFAPRGHVPTAANVPASATAGQEVSPSIGDDTMGGIFA